MRDGVRSAALPRIPTGLRLNGLAVAELVALAWMLSVALACFRVAATPNDHSVYPSYVLAGRCWTTGSDIYAGTGYRYSPLVATLFSLFGPLPDFVGAPLWHLLSAGVYVLGLAVWLRRFVAVADLRSRALFFLLVLPPSLASLNNGQANALLLGLLLLGLDGVLDRRWHRVSACIVLAGAFKIYPLLLGLVLVARYPRSLGIRLALWTAAALALPFLLQQSDYVLHEYQKWFEHLRNDDRQILPVPLAYRDLRLLLRTCGMPIGQSAYFVIQMLAAGALVGIAALRRGAEQKSELALMLTISTFWMTVLGPSTEACTYILLAPALAQTALRAWQEKWRLLTCAALASAYFLVTYPQLPYRLWGAGVLGNHAAQCAGGLLFAAIVLGRAVHAERNVEKRGACA